LFSIEWLGGAVSPGVAEMEMSPDRGKGSALPKAWIVPIRLFIYALLAACSGYIYFNVGELEFTHYLVIITIVAVSAMALLDCKVSDEYWRQESKRESTKSEKRNRAD
jgi:hypothetical protein